MRMAACSGGKMAIARVLLIDRMDEGLARVRRESEKKDGNEPDDGEVKRAMKRRMSNGRGAVFRVSLAWSRTDHRTGPRAKGKVE